VIRSSIKQFPKYKSTDSKKEELKETIKMKTPIGKVKYLS
jgi:hypothetical protein